MTYIQIHCSCPDIETAEKIAKSLVSQQLVACAQIIPQITSVYQWNQQIETATESLLLLKTTQIHYPKIETVILDLHPYELPEIITVPIQQGFSSYLTWIQQCTTA